MANDMRDKIAEIIRNARMFADPLSQVGYAEADALIAKGVILPPCKVGDKIYMLVTRKTHSFTFEKGKRMLRVDNQHTFVKETYFTKLNFFKVLDDIGKTVFLTKEEAEAKLKESESNAN